MTSNWEVSLRVYYEALKEKRIIKKSKLPTRIRGRSYFKTNSNTLTLSAFYETKDYFDSENFEIIVTKAKRKNKKKVSLA